jgi:hypothetical protein
VWVSIGITGADAKGFLDERALVAVSRGQAEVVSHCHGRSWNMQFNGFRVGPDTSPLFAGVVLYDFILDGMENTLSALWVLGSTYIPCSPDEERTF